MSEVSVSILDCDFNNLNSEIEKVNNTNINYIHIDIMDGVFVDRNTKKLFDLDKISNLTDKNLDIHLMIEDPLDSIDEYININPYLISFHIENNNKILKCINKIKSKGIKAGIAINPNTNLNLLKPYLNDIDLVLVMSVFPGKGGQKFIDSTYERIQKLNYLKDDYDIKISVDGGVNNSNSKKLLKLGSDILVSGSFLMKNSNILTAYKSLLNH
tara:strand:- start:1857 stop:2498 length:642 start_codon:yes stop_codon:yes gene_type:complete